MSHNGQTQSWIEAARRGDRLALAKLLAVHHPVLAARVNARIDPALRQRTSPEDILQEVYLQVFRRLEGFEDRGPDSFLNWVLTILDHKLIDARRAARRARRDVARETPATPVARSGSYLNLLDEVYRDSITPSRIVRRQEAVGALLACVSGLSESHRQVIELRFLQALPVAEVARRLDRTEGAIVALSQRALAALREAMNRMGDVTHGG